MHFISWWGLVGFIAISIAMLITGNRAWGIASLVACGVFVVSRTLAFILSRHLSCPLCMGKVMASVRCHKHVNAQCLPPLTHRATAVLAVLFTLSFRCMYCGTRFRLRK
jgi:hypothetical protein